ncbi:Oidioi.mRNA.OKI2018_I69.XSR.g13938.t1.cds [Oikopleura dioica]|uniref:Oidioi.mRNA.OKI2018_I69.XSR.g13938.t1.cds n=1 Tax=Oikopleura dioica TaxID=34765 RepID=A0ABN7SCD0_OIKDI|nr:Oidioi.mRNA.OKI2018_I69.XSR.g13938.t1.cds [Oikopleura dioica]
MKTRVYNKADKPPFSYGVLTALVIRTFPEKRARLGQIYSKLEALFPALASSKSAWRDSVRHNLVQREFFVKQKSTGSHGFWTVEVAKIPEAQFKRQTRNASPTCTNGTMALDIREIFNFEQGEFRRGRLENQPPRASSEPCLSHSGSEGIQSSASSPSVHEYHGFTASTSESSVDSSDSQALALVTHAFVALQRSAATFNEVWEKIILLGGERSTSEEEVYELLTTSTIFRHHVSENGEFFQISFSNLAQYYRYSTLTHYFCSR